MDADGGRQLMQRHMLAPNAMMKEACKELAALALAHEVPMIFHNTRSVRILTWSAQRLAWAKSSWPSNCQA